MLIKKLELNVNSFSLRCNLPSQSVHNMVKGRKTSPSFDSLYKILSTFEDVNVEWLILGKGEMFKGNSTNILNEPKVNYDSSSELKDKYIAVIEENRELSKEVLDLKERLRRAAVDNVKNAS